MSYGAEAVTTASLALALDAASLRHRAIATNIANANVAGYVPLTVSFESQLEDVQQSLRSSGRIDPFALAGVVLGIGQEENAAGTTGGVQLDAEVAKMSQNSLHYQALLKGISRHLGILATAASDGKK